jgi:16S rRNA (cytidine1402-2'-O)-methyltransferase
METLEMEEEGDTADVAAPGAESATRPAPGALYVVATPLGNARDLTLRAIDILRGVDIVAAEDTRITLPFLRRHGIAAKVVSAHAHNEARRAQAIVAMLAGGKSVAVVSDAGTPAISDPGARLVSAVRDAGYPVVPIPGPCAVAAAVSAAGLEAQGFAFVGFLPPTPKLRRALIESVAPLPLALVIYEAPHRVRATVAELAQTLAPPRMLVIARELTKVFETIVRVPLDDAVAWLDAEPNRQRGEFVLIVDRPVQRRAAVGSLDADARRLLGILLDEMPPARAARALSAYLGVSRDEVYDAAIAMAPRAPR